MTSRPEIKKRRGGETVDITMEAPTPWPTTGTQTVTWDDISEWQRDNKFILNGYRRETADYLATLKSLTFLHNETCNIYTHLVGAVALPIISTAIMRFLSEPRFLNVSTIDYIMFGFYFVCAECCLVFSVLYHLLSSHSYDIERIWHRMDLIGIIIMTVGTFVPGMYYIFICEAVFLKIHWAIIITSGTATGTLMSMPKFRTPRWRTLRTGAFVVLGSSSLLPLLHGTQLFGLKYMLQYSGMKWYLLELSSYCLGVIFYGVSFLIYGPFLY